MVSATKSLRLKLRAKQRAKRALEPEIARAEVFLANLKRRHEEKQSEIAQLISAISDAENSNPEKAGKAK